MDFKDEILIDFLTFNAEEDFLDDFLAGHVLKMVVELILECFLGIGGDEILVYESLFVMV